MHFKLTRERRGDHTHLTLFAAPAPDQTYANIGTLTCTEDEGRVLVHILIAGADEAGAGLRLTWDTLAGPADPLGRV